MELEEIEALSNLSALSRVDLFNLLGRVEQLNRRLGAERKRRKIDIDNKTPKTSPPITSELTSLDSPEHGLSCSSRTVGEHRSPGSSER